MHAVAKNWKGLRKEAVSVELYWSTRTVSAVCSRTRFYLA
jgi:hypothetical protein